MRSDITIDGHVFTYRQDRDEDTLGCRDFWQAMVADSPLGTATTIRTAVDERIRVEFATAAATEPDARQVAAMGWLLANLRVAADAVDACCTHAIDTVYSHWQQKTADELVYAVDKVTVPPCTVAYAENDIANDEDHLCDRDPSLPALVVVTIAAEFEDEHGFFVVIDPVDESGWWTHADGLYDAGVERPDGDDLDEEHGDEEHGDEEHGDDGKDTDDDDFEPDATEALFESDMQEAIFNYDLARVRDLLVGSRCTPEQIDAGLLMLIVAFRDVDLEHVLDATLPVNSQFTRVVPPVPSFYSPRTFAVRLRDLVAGDDARREQETDAFVQFMREMRAVAEFDRGEASVQPAIEAIVRLLERIP